MRALPLELRHTHFPTIERRSLETLQVNLGYRCNQRCEHCHVNASPERTEAMTWETMLDVLALLERSGARTLDLTGGAPELNRSFREFVQAARAQDVHVVDRCNLTILEEPGHEDLADFLAAQQIEVIASLPCYLEENVDQQRGDGVFAASIRGLRRLNRLGYGLPDTGLALSLVYNPLGPVLPPEQTALENRYREELRARYGIEFTRLFTLANMPIKRFSAKLFHEGRLDDYLGLLRSAHRDENLEFVMCRTLLSIDWRGYVYDCDFNQMLGLAAAGRAPLHVRDIDPTALNGWPIAVAEHCYGCTAGAGSSCGGALGSSG